MRRVVGLCASLLAAAQIVMVSTPAYAAPAATGDTQAATSPDTKPAKPGKNTKKSTAAKKKPKKGDKTPAADTSIPPPPAPAPEATPAPAPATPAPAAATPVSTTTLTAAEVPAATDTKAADAKPEAKQADGTVDVHIDSPRAVTLEKRSAESTWSRACDAPCDTKLGVSDEYRLVGSDLNASEPFRLDASKGKVVLTVDPGTSGGQTRGLITTIASGAVLAGGIVVMAVGVKKHGNADGELSQPTNDGALLAGGLMVFAGIVGGIVGTSWLVTNAHTQVEGDVGTAVSTRTASRQPTFTGPTKPAGAAAFTSVPLFSGSF